VQPSQARKRNSLSEPAASIQALFACPVCHTNLQLTGHESYHCPADGFDFHKEDGIWKFLPPHRLMHYERFIKEYETVRMSEGRSSTGEFYRHLPFQDLSGLRPGDWKIRAVSFRALLEKVLIPMEQELRQSLVILDLGAGNGWLSNRLAQRGHSLAAVDLVCNNWDGLGTYVHYETPFTPIQAEFNWLPFRDAGIDLVIFNASLHYSTDYETTLHEAMRVLHPGGELVIMDSPVYRDPKSGFQMVSERESAFTRQFGFPSNTLPSENFLTEERLRSLSTELGIRWKRYIPFYGMRWFLRGAKARLLGRREPARFILLAAENSRPAAKNL
jgi:2-polyprenyl-3-methyl-5-hydroxy-6-metoxy-1,4-benzoquinol methylase